MARKLQIKRGLKKDMPTLAEGELGFAKDEKKVYIGTGTENVPVTLKPEYAKLTMLASKWDKTTSKYSFEAEYPSDKYDIEVGPSDDATAEQMQAYGAALIPINSTANVAVAKGEIPTVDIPLVIKAVRK